VATLKIANHISLR